MSGWGISPSASEKEKIKAEWADELGGKNSVGRITYDIYSELFDVGMDLLDKMYELGKSDGEKEHGTRQNDEKVGKWIERDETPWVQCTLCGVASLLTPEYCPKCRARMEIDFG